MASQRAKKIHARIARQDKDYLYLCAIPDPLTGKACGRPTTRAAKSGLNPLACRYHQQHKQRHGSHWCKSPRAALLAPYASAAVKVLDKNNSDAFVVAAEAGITSLMTTAGPVEIATRLKGLPPAQRAKVALARLRGAGVPARRLLAIALGVNALIKDTPEKCHRITDWRIVAIAKAAHRLASGTHRKWPVYQTDGRVKHIEMHTYPRSSGRVLRHLGTMIEKECELVIDRYLADVVMLKRAADTPGAR